MRALTAPAARRVAAPSGGSKMPLQKGGHGKPAQEPKQRRLATAAVSALVLSACLAAATPAQARGPRCFGRPATIVDRSTDGARVVGTTDSDVIVTGRGDDRIFALRGDDYICSGRGNDRIFAGGGNDRIAGRRGHDSIDTGDARLSWMGDRVLAGRGNDRVTGGNGDDHLQGHYGRDRLYGATGRDSLIGSRGNDILRGGRGVDAASYGDVPLNSAAQFSDYDAGSVVVDLLRGKAIARDGTDRLYGIENAFGTDGDDTIRGDARNNRLAGSSGSDVLRGRGGDDVLIDDDTRTYRSDEPVTPGDDALYGGRGNDTIALVFGRTIDLRERLLTGSGKDSFFSIENVDGSLDDDVIRGDDADNVLRGSWGNDLIEGRAGRDTLLGDKGEDDLDGGEDDDYLDGGPGTDTCANGEDLHNCEVIR